jgi:hypothetical protein
MFDKAGTIRVAHDLIPPKLQGKKIAFSVSVFPSSALVVMKPFEQGTLPREVGFVLRAWFPSKTSKSPLASALSILTSLQVSRPTKPVELDASVEKLRDGWAIRFNADKLRAATTTRKPVA